ncbi:hypothetical protein ACQEVZ_46170 [Dactylosporangium sp. CA-152071]|uniref:hypothetical protein n=1 Tax=Dactylosporangium sp. CA-152071 TaxID=3239933 RepID=UPI003D8BC46C
MNPVVRYVFNLDDLHGLAGTLRGAAHALDDAAGSVRAAQAAVADLPGIGGDTAAVAGGIAVRFEAAARGLRADAGWLAATVGKLAALDATFWAGAGLGKVTSAFQGDRALRRRYGRDAGATRRLGNITRTGVDLFGEDVTGSKLPQQAMRYYQGLKHFKAVDRALWQLRYPLAWHATAAADALRHAARRAGVPAAKRPDWIRRLAGDGHGLRRLRRVGNWAIPGGSAALLLEDGRQLFNQKHTGARGGLEVLRDTTATVGSGLHLASDVLNVVPVAGTVADKGVDAAVFFTFDASVMALDAVDFVGFEHGDDVVHAVGDAAGEVKDFVGGIL